MTKTPSADRDERLARALRENLKRRKARDRTCSAERVDDKVPGLLNEGGAPGEKGTPFHRNSAPNRD